MTEAVAEAAAPQDKRVTWIATALGFAAGLPYSLVVGSVGVWFTNAGLSFSAIGALSWTGLFYAFKFIWAPMFDWLVPPFANTIGRRRAWMALCQSVIVLCILGMALVDPRANILLFALFAVIAGFASASQDIVIDAWRIETAQSPEQLDKISVQYQLGYRMAAIIAGAVALLLADIWATPADPAAGWPPIFMGLAVVMGLTIFATLNAPEPLLAPRAAASTTPDDPAITALRRKAVIPVAIGWAISGAALLGFMFYTLGNPSASAAAFRDAATPYILFLTIGAPLALSYWLARKPGALEQQASTATFVDTLFERVLAPLADVVRRYAIWALPVLALAMTYRIADSIWGSFAQPFYISILGNTNSDVAVASKMVGVVMTMAGIALGGLGILWLGRMPALVIGAVLASITNLIYVDLAHGGAWLDGFLAFTRLGPFFEWATSGFVHATQAAGATIIFDKVTLGPALNRLTAGIAMENLAGGFASAVHIAWLSSIVNKRYAAVQYALLSSLALLIGVIFRPRIGEYVDAVKDQGIEAQANQFANVFMFAAWVGVLAIVLCFVEWWRQSREKAKVAAS
ncbi:MAG: beta-lactamase induction signal transducer [Alphaproteobacteria bacterium]|nr:beta-lactamase induction signal transducer [Alphaproteobacteria bacterium]